MDDAPFTVQYCFPDNNSSCRKEVQTGPGNLLLYIFLSIVSVFTVILNLLVIISISHFKELHTPTNLLILSLAVADLLVGLIVMPVNIMQLIDSCWYLGKMACSIYPVIHFVSGSGSLLSLVFIAVDRYIAVCDPLHYAARITVGKTLFFIILGWSFCLFYVIIYLYFNEHLLQTQIITRCYGECVLIIKYSWVIVDIVLFFLAPCCLILALYSAIFIIARRQAKAVSAVRNRASQTNGTKFSSSSETKAAKTLGIVILVYLACWIPFYLSSLSVESLTSSSMVWTVFGWLVYLNSSVNPLIYAIFYPWFRASIKSIVTCRIFESSSSQFNLFPENF
ncbi:trace amine-associated receptor 13c-like [Colossoma macropomum]|uniref:trace amine-associated receptor 13c-like n=1 Tax=Colossoma macropomum TaxID=42526 RepID=UPI0018647FE0|nr:trace amine-associated receptor 13c-like [Colossoma macropomum]